MKSKRLTKKQISQIISNTPQELKGLQKFNEIETFGYFQKSGANWSYWAKYIDYNENKIPVVTVFGEIQ